MRVRFVWPMDRPPISEFDDSGFTWLDFLSCAMHVDICEPLHVVNAFLIKISSSLDLKMSFLGANKYRKVGDPTNDTPM